MKTHKFTIPAMLIASGALGALACDHDAPREVESGLARYGVMQVVDDADGSYLLLDADDAPLGVVRHDGDEDGDRLSVEFDQHAAELRWSANDGALVCDGTEDPQACADGLTIAATILEDDGIDVPGFEASPADDTEFRSACETIRTWVFGESCSACYNAAARQAGDGASHSDGTCTQGAIWTSCSHTFCGGSGFEMEQGGNY